jgi:hypothetical protein
MEFADIYLEIEQKMIKYPDDPQFYRQEYWI